MTKSDLTDHIAETTQSKKKEAERLIDVVVGRITEALVKGEKVDLRGFGSSRPMLRRSGKAETRKPATQLLFLRRPSRYLAEQGTGWPRKPIGAATDEAFSA